MTFPRFDLTLSSSDGGLIFLYNFMTLWLLVSPTLFRLLSTRSYGLSTFVPFFEQTLGWSPVVFSYSYYLCTFLLILQSSYFTLYRYKWIVFRVSSLFQYPFNKFYIYFLHSNVPTSLLSLPVSSGLGEDRVLPFYTHEVPQSPIGLPKVSFCRLVDRSCSSCPFKQ